MYAIAPHLDIAAYYIKTYKNAFERIAYGLISRELD